jgi:tRNA-uridine 2-sulfurtransferase
MRIFVGLSGGVDSSVSAALLVQAGYSVTGVYMKNWSQDIAGNQCPWLEDYQDAKRVAAHLNIPFKVYDFQDQYKQQVVDYMVAEYSRGNTPNPDIMCNQEVKFKLFLETALSDGADAIATGHYAISSSALGQEALGKILAISNNLLEVDQRSTSILRYDPNDLPQLRMAIDDNKDQTYFLSRISGDAVAKSIFPLGHLTKPQVRQLALKLGLPTAKRKESMGICFVGKVGIKDFLSEYVTSVPGDIINQRGEVVGVHDGAIFYTIGQRSGLGVGGGLPYYVTAKDMTKNQVFVSDNLQDAKLWTSILFLTDVHWISGKPKNFKHVAVRTRHRAKLETVVSVDMLENGNISIMLLDEMRAATPGQSAVLYQDGICLGSGIITSA